MPGSGARLCLICKAITRILVVTGLLLKIMKVEGNTLRAYAGCLLFFLFLPITVCAQSNRQLRQDRNDQTGEKRIALVIGNGSYSDVPLKNPVNDAQDMSAALKGVGFEVLSYSNLDQNAMKRAIRDFGTRLRTSGGVGLFYYAGHGVQSKGRNYLIPVSARVETEEEVEYESVDLGLVLAQMESAGNKLNIVILDACRNNPFARSFRSAEKGLASVDAPSGTIIAYSTAPGSVALDGSSRNGLYTSELLKQIEVKDQNIESVFKRVRIEVQKQTQGKQIPWESSSLVGEFYFDANRPIVPRTATPTNNERTGVLRPDVRPTGSNDRVQRGMFFAVELLKCVKSGTNIQCFFKATNEDQIDKKLFFSTTGTGAGTSAAYDDQGGQGKEDGWQIGNGRRSSLEKPTLLPGITVDGTVRFKNFSPTATVIRRLDLKFTTVFSEGGWSKRRYFTASFDNVPLR